MNDVLSPMPGRISRVLVSIGDRIGEETVVMIHEAMKMENSIFAACEGVVTNILVKEGDLVEHGQKLVVVE
ncbi:MAG: acetyl-CoA carboxylase biotin carboxyl carrier protein subunit [bacterium]